MTKDSESIERDLGEQPIAQILEEKGLQGRDLVSASTESITFKMVGRACKGRRLSPHVQAKICRALNRATGSTYSVEDLFSY